MKKIVGLVLVACIMLCLCSCFGSSADYETDSQEVIGNDWHSWGTYDFVRIGDLAVGILKEYNEDNEVIGFNIYADSGDEPGSQLAAIRFDDAGLTADSFDTADCFVFEDYNEDGLCDIGVKTKDGAAMWYTRDESRRFNYFETQTEKG